MKTTLVLIAAATSGVGLHTSCTPSTRASRLKTVTIYAALPASSIVQRDLAEVSNVGSKLKRMLRNYGVRFDFIDRLISF
jgi:hypothetical protein